MAKNKSSTPIQHLAILNKRGRVSLFVGAGVSIACGLPNWNSLLDKIATKASGTVASGPIEIAGQTFPIIRARALRIGLGKKFNRSVADALYSETYQISPTIREITNSGIRRICCFNFDDLLEEAYQELGAEFLFHCRG